MAERFEINVNDSMHVVEAEPDTPLLYVLINDLRLKGPRFGCGLAQCGSCSVLLEGKEVRACVTPISVVGRRAITTLEGLPERYAQQRGRNEAPDLHPIQQAMIDEQAIQCGYCFNGMMIKATELLESNSRPTAQEIKTAMNGHLCRCGTYPRIVRAVQAAAAKMAGEPA